MGRAVREARRSQRVNLTGSHLSLRRPAPIAGYIATYRTYHANTRTALLELNLLTGPSRLANCLTWIPWPYLACFVSYKRQVCHVFTCFSIASETCGTVLLRVGYQCSQHVGGFHRRLPHMFKNNAILRTCFKTKRAVCVAVQFGRRLTIFRRKMLSSSSEYPSPKHRYTSTR
jgi:hypothetical protein